MAPQFITRLRHAVQEALTPPVALFRCRAADPEAFQSAVADYYRAKAADEADKQSGALFTAYQRHDAMKAAIEQQTYGVVGGDRDARLRAAARECRDAETIHQERFSLPRWNAASAVYQAPAPTLAALVAKIEVAESEDDMAEPDAIEAIIADVRRIAGEA